MATYCNAFKMETDENKFGFDQNPDSFASWQGRRGPYYTPVLAADGTLSWVNNGGLPNPAPVNIAGPPGQGLEIRGVVETMQQLPTGAAQGDVWLVGTASPYEAYIWVSGGWLDLGQVAVGPQGPQGEPGTDGVSPEIAVTEISGGHRVTITDADGTQTFDVMDGEDGQPGSPGAAGVSPDVTVTAITGGHRVTITDADGTQTFDVLDGEDGQPGSPGAAGVSPDVTVTTITGGHRVTITDAGGTQTFDVMDGEDGQPGPAGPGVAAGGTAGQVLAKASATDYDTEWVNPPAWDLLWTNASPTSSFAGQTVSIPAIASYTVIAIEWFHSASVRSTYVTLAFVGSTARMLRVGYSRKTAYISWRDITINSSNFVAGNGNEGAAGQNATDQATNNNVCAPYRVWGVV